MFKGYVSRDRRKAYVVEADKAADHLLKRAAAARERLPNTVLLFALLPGWAYCTCLAPVLDDATLWCSVQAQVQMPLLV